MQSKRLGEYIGEKYVHSVNVARAAWTYATTKLLHPETTFKECYEANVESRERRINLFKTKLNDLTSKLFPEQQTELD
jgi:hypothetical protein